MPEFSNTVAKPLAFTAALPAFFPKIPIPPIKYSNAVEDIPEIAA